MSDLGSPSGDDHGKERDEVTTAGDTASRQHLDERFDAVLAEIRRQGRASVSAQASAETCLRTLEQWIASNQADSTAASSSSKHEVPIAAVLDALLPALDALDAAVSRAKQLADGLRPGDGLRDQGAHEKGGARGKGGARHLLRRWLNDGDAVGAQQHQQQLQALATGIALVRSEMRRGLAKLDVEIDDAAGGPIDSERHRVVEVKGAAPRSGHHASSPSPATTPQGAVVAEVLRPGYFLRDGHCLRETDVVARERGG